jgi:hypothetical protein
MGFLIVTAGLELSLHMLFSDILGSFDFSVSSAGLLRSASPRQSTETTQLPMAPSSRAAATSCSKYHGLWEILSSKSFILAKRCSSLSTFSAHSSLFRQGLFACSCPFSAIDYTVSILYQLMLGVGGMKWFQL